jgi:IS605 OrfB family transposase
MKLIAQVRLQPTPDQAEALRQTMLAYNDAANYISDQAWMRKSFRAYDLHHATYYAVRERFGLSAQLTIRVIKDVADAYKLDTKRKRTFRRMGSMTYDSRVLRWMLDKSEVSIWTMTGRQKMPFVCGERQRQMLETLQGEADLVYRNGEWYLHQPCNILEDDGFDPDEWLGVDLGIVNIATTSDGATFTGADVLGVRKRRRRQRKRLQAKTTSSARRVLRRLSGREARFARDVNHRISKRIVEEAKRTARGIALEELKGIRTRVRLRRSQRDNLHSWAFFQLKCFVEYKAQWHGVPVKVIDPRYTSQTCSRCGHVAKANRPSQDVFLCVACGYAAHADHNAAINIGRRALVRAPDVSADVDFYTSSPGTSSPALAGSI